MRFFKLLLAFTLMASCSTHVPTPSAQFQFPDEWEEHEATIMIFPAHHSYRRAAAELQREAAGLANAIQKHEQVHLFVHDDDLLQAEELLGPGVQIHHGSAYRIDWARDNAPLVTRDANGDRRAVCFGFNGWGQKYNGWKQDVGVSAAIAQALNLPISDSDLVLEGGAVEIGSTDQGLTGIATEQCVLNPNRTSWSKARVERELKEKLGLDRIVWLPKGLNPDPMTDGHVDGLLKFIDENTVLLHTTNDTTDENYETCIDAKRRLEDAGLSVIELPLADDIVHMNSYIGSGGKIVYVPVCGDPEQDEPALRIMHKLFDVVVPIEANAMGKAGGGVHCFTQQVPAGKAR